MLYYYNGSLADAAGGTASMDRSTYSASNTYPFYESGTIITESDFSNNFNQSMELVCLYWDGFIYYYLDFGLKGLGFISYDGYGATACDPLAVYHTGNTEIRNAYSATCTVDGYTGDTYCTSCGAKVRTGSTIASKGYHSYSNSCDKDCNTCGAERQITHSYSNSCDTDCNTCGAERNVIHSYSSECDKKCNLCGYTRIALAEHTFNTEGICQVCDALECGPGDMNSDEEINDADAMYLLRYTLFGEGRYPLSQSGDVNGDGTVSDADAMYLLRYTLFGESRYPLH
jgi:hypothetical protein